MIQWKMSLFNENSFPFKALDPDDPLLDDSKVEDPKDLDWIPEGFILDDEDAAILNHENDNMNAQPRRSPRENRGVAEPSYFYPQYIESRYLIDHVEAEVRSGISPNIDLVIYIDVERAMSLGLCFYRSSNTVICCEGPIPLKCVLRVVRLSNGSLIDIDAYEG